MLIYIVFDAFLMLLCVTVAAINIKQQGILKLKAEGLSVSANGGKRKSSTLLVAA